MLSRDVLSLGARNIGFSDPRRGAGSAVATSVSARQTAWTDPVSRRFGPEHPSSSDVQKWPKLQTSASPRMRAMRQRAPQRARHCTSAIIDAAESHPTRPGQGPSAESEPRDSLRRVNWRSVAPHCWLSFAVKIRGVLRRPEVVVKRAASRGMLAYFATPLDPLPSPRDVLQFWPTEGRVRPPQEIRRVARCREAEAGKYSRLQLGLGRIARTHLKQRLELLAADASAAYNYSAESAMACAVQYCDRADGAYRVVRIALANVLAAPMYALSRVVKHPTAGAAFALSRADCLRLKA